MDLRYAARALRRSPGFTAICSLTLGVSLGAATAVFSVVNGVLIKPLPYPDSDALVSLWNVPRAADSSGAVPFSATQFFTYRDQNHAFAAFGLWTTGAASVTGQAEPQEVRVARVTTGTLQALGVKPVIGRAFSPDDERPGSPETVMLTHAYWRRRFGSDINVVGSTLIVDAQPRIVIGVMPAGFRLLNATVDVIVPFKFDRATLSLGSFNYFALARLRPGVSIEQANVDVARLVPIWLTAWPSPPGFDKQAFATAPLLRPLKQDVVGDSGEVLWVVVGAVALVVLISSANVANLLLVRAERRRHEFAVRAALGAAWHRLARELLIESLLLGSIGGVLAIGVAAASLRLLVNFSPASVPRLEEITIDPQAVSFAVIVSIGSSLLFGLIPVLRHAGPRTRGLGAADRTSSDDRKQHRARSILVVTQVAIALVLVIASALMIRTFLALRAVQPGFVDPDRVQLVRLTIPAALVGDPERVLRVQTDIRDRVAAIAGVEAASFASAAPMEPFVSANVVFAADGTETGAKTRRFKFVSPGYFAAVGTPVIAGRDFDWGDLHQRRSVAVISEKMAREVWGEPTAALGRRIRENPESPWRSIVGVVGDVFDDGVDAPPPAMAYWPALMENFEGDRIRIRRSTTLTIRSRRAGSEGLVKEIQQAVWAVNPNLPLARVQTLATVYAGSLTRTSVTLVMLAISASLALLLGLMGIYGVIAYAVAQRTREIGIRVALGASPVEVKRMFVRQGIVLAVIGVIGGLAAAVALTRLLSSLLFGVSPLDPPTYVAMSVMLIIAAAAASYIPAHNATAVDPMRTLRV